jgi:lysophospholipase L1-like esterase
VAFLVKLALLRLARPLLLANLAHYEREVRRAPFPVDAAEHSIAGPDPDRLLFVGDAAVAGYGVLHEGMATPSRTARLVAKARERGCRWETVAAADLTAASAARAPGLEATDADVVVIMLGVPDVLLGTRTIHWVKNLRTIVRRVRAEAGTGHRIVFAGIPPIAEFRPLPALARTLMIMQIQRLNGATRVVASETPDATYVPFPAWHPGEQHHEEQICWKSMHKLFAHALAPAIVAHL